MLLHDDHRMQNTAKVRASLQISASGWWWGTSELPEPGVGLCYRITRHEAAGAGAGAVLTPNCVRLSTSAQWSAAAPDQNLPPVSGPKIFVDITKNICPTVHGGQVTGATLTLCRVDSG